MAKSILKHALPWFDKFENLVAVQLQIGRPARMVFYDGGHPIHGVIEVATHPLTADDTLAVVQHLFPDSDDLNRGALLAGRPLTFPQPDHKAIVSIAHQNEGFEIWIHRLPINARTPTPDDTSE